MSHIFISYSRVDLDFAGKIVQVLADNALDTWIDWKSIPKGEDWEQEIYRGIEQADAFLFLISPDSVASQMCNKEIAHAFKNGKRILPIVVRDADPKNIHPEISKRNWIFCRYKKEPPDIIVVLDNFNDAIEETRKTIHTDYEWLKYHTELQVKALKWEQKKDNSRLLRGKELREAEQQLTEVSAQEDPQCTKIQREYILASQRNEIHTRRQITIGLVFGLAIVTMLAIFAWNERNNALNSEATAIAEANAKATAIINEAHALETAQADREVAEEKARIALANQIAILSSSKFDTELDISLLLGAEAYQMNADNQTYKNLLEANRHQPKLIQLLHGGQYSVFSVEYSPDGKMLASSGNKGIQIWDAETGQKIGAPITTDFAVFCVTFSPDGKLLAGDGFEGLVVWDINRHEKLQTITRTSSESHEQGCPSFNPEGDILAYNDGRQIMFWNIADSSSVNLSAIGDSQNVIDVEFSPDGKLLASSGMDGIRIWDSSAMKLIQEFLTGHSGEVGDIEFSPDGRFIASAGWDGVIQLWDLNTEAAAISPMVVDGTVPDQIEYVVGMLYLARMEIG